MIFRPQAPDSPQTDLVSASGGGIRANARRGQNNPSLRSYPPVESVVRALHLLKLVTQQGVATVHSLHAATGIPKPTVVRLLETLIGEGYVTRDNMCGGYRATSEVQVLTSGYGGVPRILEVAHPLAIELTREIKWPVGIGFPSGDAIELLFWTGAISPYAHRSAVLGVRADIYLSAMGRAYLAFCPEDERERRLAELRADSGAALDEMGEQRLRAALARVRMQGFAFCDPRRKPMETTTLAAPLMVDGTVKALVNVSYYRSAVPHTRVGTDLVSPLLDLTRRIEEALAEGHAAIDSGRAVGLPGRRAMASPA